VTLVGLRSAMAAVTGIFVVRAWLEPGSTQPLRATIRSTGDVARGIEHELTVTDGGVACAHLLRWIEELRAGAGGSE
jgi:hypothetical protein